jgi:hypothetical protein
MTAHPFRLLAAALLASVAPLGGALQAQDALVRRREATIAPAFESWSFGDGILQPALRTGDSVFVRRASQWSTPVSASTVLGRGWSLDLSAAYVSGTVTLAARDTVLHTDEYTLDGLTDVRLRATGRLIGDAVLVTLGANIPSGTTSLDARELSALRVLAAPALGFQAPALGTGPGGTAGLVLARPMGSWAWALALAYEMRGTYAPIAAFTAGASEPDFDPGDAMHVSLGTDGLVGAHGMTLGVSADFYTDDELTSGGEGGTTTATTKLGPIVTAEWQLRVATHRFRELALYAVARTRAKFERAGETVAGSDGQYYDAGVRGVLPLTRSSALVTTVDARYHTGLAVDRTLATAAVRAGGVTIGWARDVSATLSLQPFVRGQLGTLDSGGDRASVRGLSGGVSLTMRR